MNLHDIISDEPLRHREFPVTQNKIFMAHAGVAPLSRAAAAAITEFAERAARDDQENEWAAHEIGQTRRAAARLLGCEANEVALLGPTALGLNLVANGLDWKAGEEVIYYPDDYPANVYPWSNLATRGVRPVALQPAEQGVITWDLIEPLLTKSTRLVALASCNFVSGYRIDVAEIGKNLHARGVLFCLDGIQTLGAFPTPLEFVDFMSADSHKWLLGPVGSGVFYVKAARQELLKPTVLGSWNVVSPNFISQGDIKFHSGSRRYEPGTFNIPGILGMGASMDLLAGLGVDNISTRILKLRESLLDALRPFGYRLLVNASNSGIVSVTHAERNLKSDAERLRAAGITASVRSTRAGQDVLRFSPHFYNTFAEIEQVAKTLTA